MQDAVLEAVEVLVNSPQLRCGFFTQCATAILRIPSGSRWLLRHNRV